jgi:hypothetical protein
MRTAATTAIGVLLVALQANAQAVRDLPGFRASSIPRNDDGSSPNVPLGFTADFFSRRYSAVFVNNNGNLTFDQPLSEYTPFGLAGTNVPIIAAFFADVDTRPPASQVVTYGRDQVDGRSAFGVNYFRVGYFNEHADRLNTFQIVLVDRSDTGPGNFDIEFNYARIEWDTGDLARSGGGKSAVAGFSNGTRAPGTLYQLPGSLVPGSFVDAGSRALTRNSLNSNVPGRYIFQARYGTVSSLRISTPSQMPPATLNQSYASPPLTASGGAGRYTWSAVNWPEDLGLSLDPATGAIRGTPRIPGTHQLLVQLRDSASTPATSHTLTITVAGAALSIDMVTGGALPKGVVGKPYSAPPFRARGGVGSRTWGITNLPADLGLTLNPQTGIVSGTPTRHGTFQVAVELRDTGVPQPVRQEISLVIDPAPLGFEVRTLPDATVGVSYTAPALKATGGVGTHSWKAVQWPAGANLRIDTATGIISGVPAHVGHYQLPVAVADWTGQEIRNVLTIQVNGARLRITASGANELPAGRVGKEYRAALSLSGHGAINWTVSKWPAQLGLRFDRNTGSITGIPAREGKYELTFTAVDSTGSSASRTFQLMIAPELRLTYPGR